MFPKSFLQSWKHWHRNISACRKVLNFNCSLLGNVQTEISPTTTKTPKTRHPFSHDYIIHNSDLIAPHQTDRQVVNRVLKITGPAQICQTGLKGQSMFAGKTTPAFIKFNYMEETSSSDNEASEAARVLGWIFFFPFSLIIIIFFPHSLDERAHYQ